MLGTKLKYEVNDKYKITIVYHFFVIDGWIARTSQNVINDTLFTSSM